MGGDQVSLGNNTNPVMIGKQQRRWAIAMLVLGGTVLALASAALAEWKEKVLYSFQSGTDGATPAGGVVFDQRGNLYGATLDGGSSSCPSPQQCGTVYQLAPPAQKGGAWAETVLYVFKGHDQNDGASPEGGLVIDNAGNLYGTTGYGGSGPCILLGTAVGCGTVFELSPPAKQGDPWKETVLYNFQGGKDGYVPFGDLVFDRFGNLYGGTLYGGGLGYDHCNKFYGYCGTIFKLMPPKTKGGKWNEKVLYAFKGGKSGKQFGDGANPNGGLVLDSKGAVYGTTFYGGNEIGQCNGGDGGTGCGTVFQLSPPIGKADPWTEKQIHVFQDSHDGSHPATGLTFDAQGRLYGTTFSGGTVFRLTPIGSHWTETILHAFNSCENGCDPEGRVIFDGSGILYGTTYSAQSFSGTVFRLKPPAGKGGTWTLGVLYGFMGPPDGAQPAAGLIFNETGNLYSTTTQGGASSNCSFHGCGTVFEISP